MELEPTEFVLNPILPVKGIGMLYAWRGVGKTNVMLEIAYCLAAGIKKCFAWEIPSARKVVYVDGEMDSAGLQERMREIAAGHAHDGFPVVSSMTLVTPDLQKNIFPNIGSAAGQRQIEKLLSPGCVLVLDNLSSLCPSGEEHETDNWVVVQEWLLYLRRCGITVLFLHHAGKGGTQRGWSGREDILNLTLALRRPANYQPEEGLRCEVHIEKLRGKASGVAVQPFEVQMASVNGRAEWTQRPLRQIIEKQTFEMFARGDKDRDICEILRLNRFQVYRLRRKWEQDRSDQS
jgi:putative DNA primase/helicase